MPVSNDEVRDRPAFLKNGGELGDLIARHDWSSTPLGPLDRWPPALKTTISLMLRSPVPIVSLWGADGIMLYNDGYSQFAGARHPALLGSKVREGWPEVADFNDDVMKVVMAGGTLSYKDMPLTLYREGRPDEAWIDLDYSPVLDEAGEPMGVIAMVQETTAKVLVERELRDSEARHRQIVDSALDYGIIASDLEGRVTRWNAGAERILGWSEDEMLGQEMGVFFTPEDQAEDRARIERQLALTEGRTAAEGWRLRRSGERFWAAGDMSTVRDEAGSVTGFVKVLRDRTAEYEGHQALISVEANLRRAQEAGGIGLFTLDLQTSMIQGTPEFYRIFGFDDPAEMPITKVEALVLPEDAMPVVDHDRRRRGDAALEVEYRILRADTGEERVIARKAEYERDVSGQPVRLIGVVQDVTERRQAQAALEQSEARFRALAQAIPNQAWTARRDGSLDWFNDQVHAYSGLTSEDLIGAGWTAMVHPDDLPGAVLRWSEALASGETYSTEFRLRRHDGVYRWHLTRAVAQREPDGEIAIWIGTNTDIHEQKLAEAASTEDRNRLWTLSRDLMLVCDYEGLITAVNPSAMRILGWTEAEMVGGRLADFTHPDDLAGTAAEVGKLANGETTLAFENRYRMRDGGYRLLDWTATPDRGRIHAVGRDVTDLRATEEALRQSQKMEAVGQLTGGIAHDFNNLLQGITGSLDLVQKRISQGRLGELDRFVAGAVTSANRAAALTHRLLAFSRRQPLDPKPVKANPLVASMEDLLRRTLGETVELELVLAGGLWLTRCDPNQLESAILNLAINARDAMPGGGKLTIETCNAHLDSAYAASQRDVRPGQYVCICVTDTGTGMDAETIGRAFEPFFTTKPIGQGTGLGLSMIYGFARQSEGYAKIYSELGRGTTIKLYLPRERRLEAEEDPMPQLSDAHLAEAGETVLVVEDEPVVRGLIVEVLSDLGYRAIEADDGPKGLEILQSRRRIDLLITDIGLPGLNGRQVADAGRERRPDLKVLFMTGYAENAAMASGFLEAGMAMITKPFAMEDLATRIRAIIEDR